MSTQPKPIKEPADSLTDEEIQRRIKEMMDAGATSCKVVMEGGKKFLVTQWPPA